MRETEQEATGDARDLLAALAVEAEAIELARLAARIGAPVRSPGHGFRMIEGKADVGEYQAVFR